MARRPIPVDLKHQLFYESQYACVVCQKRGCHIHHIDRNPANNDERNLVVLCTQHHDEAHTKRELSKNLDDKSLRDAKARWITYVATRRATVGTLEGQKSMAQHPMLSVGMIWGYINHKRVPEILSPKNLAGAGKQVYEHCRRAGFVDPQGFIIKPQSFRSSSSYVRNTIYDWYDFGDDQRIHAMYTNLVDEIIRRSQIVHIDENNWAKSKLKSLVSAGSLILVNRAFYFKAISVTRENQHRKCRTFKQNIEIEFFVDTLNMFGMTSVTVSFSGRKSCAAFLLVKSIEEKSDGKLVLHCTPIALGVGFQKTGGG